VIERFGVLAPLRCGRLETVGSLAINVRDVGVAGHEAIALARAGGFAEADPGRDLSGADSADKLALMIEAAFGQWVAPETISTRGIDGIAGNPKGYKLIARARREGQTITASVAPELPSPESFLAQGSGTENRIEIEPESRKVIKLCGQGAGRWPTAVSVVGDLHAVARLVETGRERRGRPAILTQRLLGGR